MSDIERAALIKQLKNRMERVKEIMAHLDRVMPIDNHKKVA